MLHEYIEFSIIELLAIVILIKGDIAVAAGQDFVRHKRHVRMEGENGRK